MSLVMPSEETRIIDVNDGDDDNTNFGTRLAVSKGETVSIFSIDFVDFPPPSNSGPQPRFI